MKIALRLPYSRDHLIQIVDELEQLGRPAPRPWRRKRSLSRLASLRMRGILAQIIDQLPPRRNTRVSLLPRQVAMLAVALERRHPAVTKKLLRLIALETLAPERAQDARFRELVDARCRQLRRGKDPGKGLLLPTPSDQIALAEEKLVELSANR